MSKFLRIFYPKLSFRFFERGYLSHTIQSHTPTYPLNQKKVVYRGEMSCLNQIFNVILRVEILGHIPKPYWDLSYSGLWGLRCEQSPDTSSRCDTPIFFKVEILGGRNG